MWDDRACRDADPTPWFGLTPESARDAADVCAECPHITACADLRVRVEEERGGPAVGVWGGVRWMEETGNIRAKVGAMAVRI